MFAPGMPDEALLKIAARVGADVPFCLRGGACWAEGMGERLTPLPPLPEEYRFAVLQPDMRVNTAEAYAKLDATALARPDTALVKRLALRGDWAGMALHCGNVFEQVTRLPGLPEAKAACRSAGALLTQMTGSGAAVFSLFGPGADRAGIEKGLRALGGKFLGIFKPTSHGVGTVG
jgi:4-diphosphocytidyl-2-C-methyl-D-erythritol kinase